MTLTLPASCAKLAVDAIERSSSNLSRSILHHREIVLEVSAYGAQYVLGVELLRAIDAELGLQLLDAATQHADLGVGLAVLWKPELAWYPAFEQRNFISQPKPGRAIAAMWPRRSGELGIALWPWQVAASSAELDPAGLRKRPSLGYRSGIG